MSVTQINDALACAVRAAETAGNLMRKNLSAAKKITHSHRHDIKLELDVRCQKRIEKVLRSAFPTVPILGEEGALGDPEAAERWVVDPIDGTVNFTHGIPHACISIALQTRRASAHEEYQTVAGVVYDPFFEELWTATRGRPARLNGRIIRPSRCQKLQECLLSIGFAKESDSLETMLPAFNRLIRRVRKIRMMGAAALGLVYVATGRFDAYLESGIRLWDIAAGGLILECAGGEFWREALAAEHTYFVLATNGRLRRKIQASIP